MAIILIYRLWYKPLKSLLTRPQRRRKKKEKEKKKLLPRTILEAKHEKKWIKSVISISRTPQWMALNFNNNRVIVKHVHHRNQDQQMAVAVRNKKRLSCIHWIVATFNEVPKRPVKKKCVGIVLLQTEGCKFPLVEKWFLRPSQHVLSWRGYCTQHEILAQWRIKVGTTEKDTENIKK